MKSVNPIVIHLTAININTNSVLIILPLGLPSYTKVVAPSPNRTLNLAVISPVFAEHTISLSPEFPTCGAKHYILALSHNTVWPTYGHYIPGVLPRSRLLPRMVHRVYSLSDADQSAGAILHTPKKRPPTRRTRAPPFLKTGATVANPLRLISQTRGPRTRRQHAPQMILSQAQNSRF